MIEFEKKMLLTQREYDFLRNVVFQNGVTVEQVNHYYDNDEYDWNRIGITCRIREKEGRYVATIKEHDVKGYNRESSRIAINDSDAVLFEAMNVKKQGCLQTIRTTLNPHKGVKLVLDKNRYLSHEDYELEIEYDLQAEEEANEEIRKLSYLLGSAFAAEWYCPLNERIVYSQSKAQRFFERKKKLEYLKRGIRGNEFYFG